jgi:integrase
MARIRLLTTRQVDTLGPGFHPDGANLYLRVRDTGSRAFVFRYKRGGRHGTVVELGLGPTQDRSLKQARALAGRMRTALADGGDPAMVLVRRDPAAKTFKDYALELIETKKTNLKSKKHIQQWGNTLEEYAFPSIGNKLPREIALEDVKAILKPIWSTKTETASRVRQRIEAIIDYAAVHEGTDARNPATWKGNLALAGFPAPHKATEVAHHAAAKYQDVPAIMAALREKDSTSAYCLRWTILTAARSMEARAATWSEIDLAAKLWAIPAIRMKASREHKVPLCDEAQEILKSAKLRKVKGCDLVFPGARGGLLSDVAVNKTLHAIEPDVTVHGFRASFRMWGAENTVFPSAVLELALAHTNRNKIEATYQRSDLVDLRRKLMVAWESYCASKRNVVHLVKA